MYAYVAFLVVLLTYGLETAFFRFANRNDYDGKVVYSTVAFSILSTSFLFITTAIIFNQPIADWLRYPNHNEYVIWFAIIVGLDAISSIPLARLRVENKAIRFASINLVSIGVNIGLNVFFVGYCITAYNNGDSNWILNTFYSPEIGVGYVFISNLISGIVKFLLVSPYLAGIRMKIDFKILGRLIMYSLPLLVAGLAGIVNETLDRILLKRMLIDQIGELKTMSQLGIYGACYKISIVISLFIQAFRYAAEPFFFKQSNESNSKEVYAEVMNYFVVVCALIFLGVMVYIDIIKYFIPNEEYWVGLKVVPILLMANIFLGIYYNQSIWYKLSDKTYMGALMAIGGAIITVVINILLIPTYGYMGSAWATLACYVAMAIGSFVLGQRHFPIPYQLWKIALYLGIPILMWYGLDQMEINRNWVEMSIGTLLIAVYIYMVFIIEKPFKRFSS